MTLPKRVPLNGLKVLAGYRGGPAGDLDALADVVVAMSRLAVEQPAVIEAEANPVRVHTCGVVALDALVRRAASTTLPGRVDQE